MKKPQNLLRAYRKQYQLTQTDVAFLLNQKNNSNISRYEKGERPPTVDVILAYHLLFDTQLGTYFADGREHIKSRIASRITPLLSEIEKEGFSPKKASRVTFLKDVLARFNQPRP